MGKAICVHYFANVLRTRIMQLYILYIMRQVSRKAISVRNVLRVRLLFDRAGDIPPTPWGYVSTYGSAPHTYAHAHTFAP